MRRLRLVLPLIAAPVPALAFAATPALVMAGCLLSGCRRRGPGVHASSHRSRNSSRRAGGRPLTASTAGRRCLGAVRGLVHRVRLRALNPAPGPGHDRDAAVRGLGLRRHTPPLQPDRGERGPCSSAGSSVRAGHERLHRVHIVVSCPSAQSRSRVPVPRLRLAERLGSGLCPQAGDVVGAWTWKAGWIAAASSVRRWCYRSSRWRRAPPVRRRRQYRLSRPLRGRPRRSLGPPGRRERRPRRSVRWRTPAVGVRRSR